MTDSQTAIDSLRSVGQIIDKMNQHLLDNIKKCVEGVVVKFIRKSHNLADPLTQNQGSCKYGHRIIWIIWIIWIMSSRSVTF